MNKLSQYAVQFIIILGLTAGIACLPQPGFQLLHGYLAPYYGSLFAASLVSMAHNKPLGAALVYAIALLLAYPDLHDAGTNAIPVGIGVLVGAAVHHGRQSV